MPVESQIWKQEDGKEMVAIGLKRLDAIIGVLQALRRREEASRQLQQARLAFSKADVEADDAFREYASSFGWPVR